MAAPFLPESILSLGHEQQLLYAHILSLVTYPQLEWAVIKRIKNISARAIVAITTTSAAITSKTTKPECHSPQQT